MIDWEKSMEGVNSFKCISHKNHLEEDCRQFYEQQNRTVLKTFLFQKNTNEMVFKVEMAKKLRTYVNSCQK